MSTDSDLTFAVSAIRADGQWNLRELPARATESLSHLIAELRASRAEGPVVGLLCVDDDWSVVLRPVPGGVRILLSDATAALDYDIASEALDTLDIDAPSEDEADASDDPWPEGDFDLLEDLGASEQIMSIIFYDDDLYGAEQVLRVADELGFADELADLVGVELEF
ncbi:tRNA adenosine deaminase-associated protein [Corynebacterium macclintockiae]|uniref:tRNA adenosine deaminase-associated protein n=1 Tax=Corynebacterium macclintockiae TaxID=2913501 RepID=UPI002549C988|nr:tRNA adenosine deaminase-associated protein [Corynebacterium macclintockiae]MDK8870375.1 tRNA adenosine deaminase-associated protein [Corynebacterium macclintockiae]